MPRSTVMPWAARMLLLSLFGAPQPVPALDAARHDAPLPSFPATQQAATDRTVRFSLEARNTTDRVVAGVRVGVFIPVARAVGQRCCAAIEASLPFELLRDDAGNQAVLLTLAPLAPYAVQAVAITAWPGTASDDGGSDAPLVPAALLAAEPLIEADAPPIVALAAELRADSADATARAIYAQVAARLTYDGYRRDARGALAALREGRGDCTEFMHLTVALARAAGLPARAMAGYVLAAGAQPQAAGFHNWAEVLVDGNWQIADPQRRVYVVGDGAGRYLATRVLTAGDQAGFPASAMRFWVIGDGVHLTLR